MRNTVKIACAVAAAALLLAAAIPAHSADRVFRDGRSGSVQRDGRSGGGIHREGYSAGRWDGHRGGYYHGGHRSHWDVDFWYGGPYWSPWWYSPYYYSTYPYYYPYTPYYYPYTGVIVEPPAPQEYVQRPGSGGPAQSAPAGVWYFCTESKAYYPYVKECKGGWRKVQAAPRSDKADGPRPGKKRGVWYYCAESNSYYPYVKECAGGWQTVPARPSSRR